jgi:putative acetyltransferase
MSEPQIAVSAEDPTSTDVLALLEASDRESDGLYPPASVHRAEPASVAALGTLLVARERGRALGCIALFPLEVGAGEIKRLYVSPAARRLGVGRRLLAALEERAAAQGLRLLRLETGTRQPEAIRLYESSGYERIPCFGEYAADPFSVCYEKHLGA